MIKPMVFLIIPVMFILIQLASRYEYRPLYVGDSAIVTVKHSEYTSNEKVVLNTTLAIEIETPALNIADYREINWRIKAIKEGEWNLTFQYGDQVETKKIVIGTKLTQIPNHRFKAGFFDILLNPADPSIPQDSFLEEIEIIYPERRLYIGGWHVHWLTLFILVSFISGFLFKNIFKVEI